MFHLQLGTKFKIINHRLFLSAYELSDQMLFPKGAVFAKVEPINQNKIISSTKINKKRLGFWGFGVLILYNIFKF